MTRSREPAVQMRLVHGHEPKRKVGEIGIKRRLRMFCQKARLQRCAAAWVDDTFGPSHDRDARMRERIAGPGSREE